ncbi:MAG: YggS family pyridoxal phosphate-dependent enzyme [Methylococcaceae bacterium]|jgi:pyridoxal phosphate enzyme (YggS family)
MYSQIRERLSAVQNAIRAAEYSFGRTPDSVQLIAVSKTRPADEIRLAYQSGQRDFGENYLQEALAKQEDLTDLGIVWHFIGPIQSNKTKAIAECFDWVHSVDRLKIAERLSEHRPDQRAPLNICLQVNISGEESKRGVAPADLPHLVAAVSDLPRLRLRGLMAIPAPSVNSALQRVPFRAMRELLVSLADPSLDTLSMGMSDDLEAAIAEGATMVRIGTALFGPR